MTSRIEKELQQLTDEETRFANWTSAISMILVMLMIHFSHSPLISSLSIGLQVGAISLIGMLYFSFTRILVGCVLQKDATGMIPHVMIMTFILAVILQPPAQPGVFSRILIIAVYVALSALVAKIYAMVFQRFNGIH